MRAMMYSGGILLALTIGLIVGRSYLTGQGELRPVIDEPDNSEALNAAVNVYDDWVAGNTSSMICLPAIGSPGFQRLYYEREEKRFSSLSAALERLLVPSAGSGGAHVAFLHTLSKAQEPAIGRWLVAERAGDNAALPIITREITVHYGSLECAIRLFKLLLGREDHGIKGKLVVLRQE